ncbi:hypothetical protein B0H14DRAFT_3905288 [Mycena olivaceomarginata]|nr:hypothetical protein B0H14DRAFT_3905288 [Mycena olivaceomarginata]
MPKAMVDSLLAISESVAATRYPDRVKQHAFLDEKTVALEGFSTMIPAIARDKSLYDVFFNMKNSYHQTATGPGGIISGRYPTILDLCSRIKTERELNRVGLSAATIAAQQAHHTELEDARVAAEEQAAAEAAATAKPKKSKGKKAKKSKAVIEDIDNDVSVFDDSEFPMTGSDEVDDPMQIDAERVEEGTPSTSHRTTQSLDAHASVSPPDYEGFFKKFAQLLNNVMSRPVTADFPVPPPKKRNRTHSYAHEDSVDQYATAELGKLLMDLQSKRPLQKYTRFSIPTSLTPTPSVHSGSKNLKYGAELGSAMPNFGASSNIASTSSRTYCGSSTRNTSAPQPHPQLRAYNSWPLVVADSGSNIYFTEAGMPFGPPPRACYFCQEAIDSTTRPPAEYQTHPTPTQATRLLRQSLRSYGEKAGRWIQAGRCIADTLSSVVPSRYAPVFHIDSPIRATLGPILARLRCSAHAEAALAIRLLAGYDIHPRLRLARCNTQTSRLLAINDDRPRAYEHVGRVCPPRSFPVARATLWAKMLSARCTRSAHNPPQQALPIRPSAFVLRHLNTRPALLGSERLGRLTASRNSHLQTRAQLCDPPRATRLAALHAPTPLCAIQRRSGKLDGNRNARSSTHPADPPTLRAHCGRLPTHTHGSHRAAAPTPNPDLRSRVRDADADAGPQPFSPVFPSSFTIPSVPPSLRPSACPSLLARSPYLLPLLPRLPRPFPASEAPISASGAWTSTLMLAHHKPSFDSISPPLHIHPSRGALPTSTHHPPLFSLFPSSLQLRRGYSLICIPLASTSRE